jgi:Family of unknown function (DUF6113)
MRTTNGQPAAPATHAAAVPAGAAAADARRDPAVLRAVAGVLIAVLAVALAVVEAFLVPLRIGSVPFPICVLLAMAGNIVLAKWAVRQTGAVAWAFVPPVLWLVVIIVLSLPRPEGDLIVPGTATGLVFLFGGALAGAYGIASEITRRAAAIGRTRR